MALVLHALAMPPIGGMYFRELTLPVLGKQNVWFYIENQRKAVIEFNGVINLKESIAYWQADDGRLEFEMGTELKRMLTRYRTTLREARYDAKNDRAFVCVKPPVVPALDIAMHRVRFVT